MKIFSKQLAFQPIDPIDDGLRERIEFERRRPEAIVLHEDISAAPLASLWREIADDVKSDPSWTHFADHGV